MAHLDARRAQADPAGRPGDEGDGNRRGRPHHTPIEMVLGEPVALIAKPLGLLGQVDSIAEGFGGNSTPTRPGSGPARREEERSSHILGSTIMTHSIRNMGIASRGGGVAPNMAVPDVTHRGP